MAVEKWLGPGGSDPYGYAVFMQVVAGWDAVEEILAHKRNGPVAIIRASLVPDSAR